MKILILNETLFLGGAETLAVELANSLSAIKNNTVFFAAADGPLKERLSPEMRFYPIPLFSIANIFAIVKSLCRIISEIKPDIIHSQGATVGVLAGFAAKRVRSSAKLVLTHHSSRSTRLPGFISALLFRKYCDFLVAIYKVKFNTLLSSGIPANKVALIPNFIDLDAIKRAVSSVDEVLLKRQLQIPPEAAVLVTAGRLTAGKRFDKFIDIVAYCASKSGRKFTGIILGEGEERSALEAAARNLPVNAEIKLPGYQKDVIQYLSIADVFVFPSQAEMLPMSLLEAAAAGVPVVCSDIPGNREIVRHEYNGFVSGADISDYSGYILKILNDKVLSEQMRLNSEKIIAEKYDKRTVLSKFMELYTALLLPTKSDA